MNQRVADFKAAVQTFATEVERAIHEREKHGGARDAFGGVTTPQLVRLRWWVRIFQQALTEVK